MKKHIIWAALAATGMSAGPALAQGELDSTMGASDTPKAAALATDRNGDGMISRDEVTPGTNLANRFDDRDQNGDGMLTQDEYYLPQMGLGVNNADEIYREQQDGAPTKAGLHMRMRMQMQARSPPSFAQRTLWRFWACCRASAGASRGSP